MEKTEGKRALIPKRASGLARLALFVPLVSTKVVYSKWTSVCVYMITIRPIYYPRNPCN
jgi:hypothetical protein